MRKSMFLLAVIGVLVCFPLKQSVLAMTWYVDVSTPVSGDGTSWEAALKTIQGGIAAASDGDTVLVALGTYIENIHFNGKNIIVLSTDPDDPDVVAGTVIDGSGDDPVVTFSGSEDESCLLSGFTIQNGSAWAGGGVCGGPGYGESSSPYTHATIQNNVIKDNGAEEGGGIAFCDGTVVNNTITGNGAVMDGAGLYDCDGIIMNNRIVGNDASECAGGLGECDGTIQNNLIAGNSAWEGGGGLYQCHGTILNNTIVDNFDDSVGGVFQCYGLILNCVIWGNTQAGSRAQIEESNTPLFSCVQDWIGGGRGNISDAPHFVDAEGGNYRLQVDSPCIDTGANFYWFAWPQRDLDGNCRLWGKRVDMGCYEYGSSPDSDGDLLTDLVESSLAPNSPNPNNDDSDGDGLRDGLEALRGSNPMGATPPRTVLVPSEVPTIQEALGLSIEGDVISIEPGTYRENIHFPGTDVVLRNFQYGNPNWWWWLGEIIIDGGGAGPAVSFEGSESPECLVAGLTIRNGRAYNGGGIRGGRRGRHTHATIAANEIVSNATAGYQSSGAGIALCDGLIEGNTIASNSGDEGGCGLAYCHGTIRNNGITQNSHGGLWYCDGAIEGNTISANSGSGLFQCHGTIRVNSITGNSSLYGGGLNQCDGIIEGNTISENQAERSGGGLYECQGTIQDNVITENTGDPGGGLAYCHAAMQNNVISGNVGGGLVACDGTIQNNLVSGNSGNRGGGLSGCGGLIQGNTIVGNSATETGGGVNHCYGTIVNCIIWGNTAEESGDQIYDSSIPQYCCIQGWSGGGIGNVSADPLFVKATEGDYHLRPDSPCIDTGLDYYWIAWPQRDLDGNCRLLGPRVDMGCYEYGASQDSDGDLLSDSDEAALETNPEESDTDGDGLRDGLESLRATDPLTTTPAGLLLVPSSVESVQGGLCLGRDGDEIVVAPGTYMENLYFCGWDVTLRSCDPSDSFVVASTILDGTSGGPVVSFTGYESEACVLSGFTIRNGRGQTAGGVCGGRLDTPTLATIKNNIITENAGALFYCDGLIENNIISRNTGEGIWQCDGTIRNNVVSENLGIGIVHCDGMIENNTVSGNSEHGLVNCKATIRGNTISSNHERGLYLCRGIIENNTISGNSAYDGAGMYDCGWLIQGNLIIENTAGRNGGGLFRCGGTIRNNVIAGNIAGERGGGLYRCGHILNNTIVGNRAGQAGGGLWYPSWAPRNCIFWGNTAPEEPQFHGAGPVYSCVQGWTGGEGNISANPLFIDPDGPDNDPDTYEDNDYRLQAGSPCIDTGENDDWMWDAGDLDGNKRIANGTVDMGAFEFGADPLFPPRLYVDAKASEANDGTSWTDAFADLQDALDLAAGSEGAVREVWIAAGTYTPDRGTGDREATFQLVNGVATYGGFAGGGESLDQRDPAANETILSGDLNADDGPDFANNAENSYHVVTASGTDATAVLDGFTVTGGNADGLFYTHRSNGGGVYNDAGSPTLRNCTIRGNVAYSEDYHSGGYGGGLFNSHGNATLINCTISNNQAGFGVGGGMYCDQSDLTITDCTISDNEGGGISCNSSSPMITGCTISGNSGGYGGGINCEYRSSPVITNCALISNSAEYDGGGLRCYIESNPTLTNCAFIGNSAVIQRGGGIFCYEGSDPTLTNCTFTGNSAGRKGGAVCCQRKSNPTIANCIMWGDAAPDGGAEIALLYYSSGGAPPSASTITVSYSDVEGGAAGVDVDTGCTLNWGEGNIEADPLLMPDGQLPPASPAIDAADNAAVLPCVLTDLAGNPRIVNGTVDMGAFEFGSIPRVTISKDEDVVTLEWQEFGDGQYNVEWTDDLVHVTWQPAPGTPASEVIWSDIISGEVMQRFYRVESGGVYSDPVGFVKVLAVGDGLTMTSVPLIPADNRLNGGPGCVGDMFKEALTGGTSAEDADTLWKWDSGTQSYATAYIVAGWGEPYDGKWWDDAIGGFSTMRLNAGECFWILRRLRAGASP